MRNTLALLVSLCVTLMAATATAELHGAVGCRAGELTIITSDNAAVWQVYPAEYATSYAISEDGKTLYFASPKAGKITFFAASVVDGAPFLESHPLYNGIDVPDVEPTPAPVPTPTPQPTPEPAPTLESVTKTAANEVKSDNKPAETAALQEVFESVASGIDRGTIKTTEGARATFRGMWAEKAVQISERTLSNWEKALSLISAQIDNTSIATIKLDYTAVAKALGETIPKTAEPADESADEPEEDDAEEAEADKTPPKPAGNSSCPNGQCPNQPQYQTYRPGWFR